MKVYSFLLLIFTLLFWGCNGSSNDQSALLAEVGGKTLNTAQAKANIPAHIFEEDSLSALSNYTEEWVKEQVILQEAERLNFLSQPGVQDRLQRIQEEFILQSIQDYIVNEMEGDIEVTELEAQDYYQQNKDKFTLEEQYIRYRHVITESNSAAEEAKQELMRGIAWEEVARKYSKYPELKIRESEKYWPISIAGGDYSTLNRYLRIIGPSEISPTYRSDNEFHFVQLLDERPEGDHPELDWLIDQIKEWLLLEKRKRAFNTYVKNLYLQAQANNEIKLYNFNSSRTDTVSSNQITNEE